MSEMTIEFKLSLPTEVLQRLEAEAERQHLPLPAVVREAIETYLNELDEDTPDEQILANFREGFADALAGRTRPAREVLGEIRREITQDGDEG